MKKLAALILVLLLVLPMTVLAEEPAEATAETVTEIITWENMTAQEEIGKYAAYGSFIKLDKRRNPSFIILPIRRTEQA